MRTKEDTRSAYALRRARSKEMAGVLSVERVRPRAHASGPEKCHVQVLGYRGRGGLNSNLFPNTYGSSDDCASTRNLSHWRPP